MHIRNKKDCVFGVCIFLGAVFFYYQTYFFQKVQSFSIGPAAFPRLVLGGLILLSAVMIVQSLGFGAKAPEQEKSEKPAAAEGWDLKSFITQASFIGLIIVYILLLPVLGYIPATVLFLFVAMMMLGKRSPRRAVIYAIVSAGVTLVMKFVFQDLLLLFLP